MKYEIELIFPDAFPDAIDIIGTHFPNGSDNGRKQIGFM